MIDYTYLFSNLLKRENQDIYPKSNNVLVILWSGGFGILASDIITGLGLKMPYFEGKTLEKLMEIYPLTIGNPLLCRFCPEYSITPSQLFRDHSILKQL